MLDSSVVVKWLIDEEQTAAALTYRLGHIKGTNPIAVPELLFYEIANVLGVKKRLTPAESHLLFATIWDIELESYHLGSNDYLRMMTLSDRLDVSGYDAAYIALAERLDAQFVTADAKLVRRCGELSFVKLL